MCLSHCIITLLEPKLPEHGVDDLIIEVKDLKHKYSIRQSKLRDLMGTLTEKRQLLTRKLRELNSTGKADQLQQLRQEIHQIEDQELKIDAFVEKEERKQDEMRDLLHRIIEILQRKIKELELTEAKQLQQCKEEPSQQDIIIGGVVVGVVAGAGAAALGFISKSAQHLISVYFACTHTLSHTCNRGKLRNMGFCMCVNAGLLMLGGALCVGTLLTYGLISKSSDRARRGKQREDIEAEYKPLIQRCTDEIQDIQTILKSS